MGLECQILTQIDLRTIRGQDLSLKFGIDLRCREGLQVFEAHRLTGIILLTVENGRMLHGTRYTRFPVGRVRTVIVLAAIGIGQLYHTAESHLLADHTHMATRCDDLVGPPARSDLYGQGVLGIGSRGQCVGNIVSEGAFGLLVMGESRFQDLLANRLAVHVKRIDTQTGRHPVGRLYLLLIFKCGYEPACAIGSSLMNTPHRICHDRSIGSGDPFRGIPSRMV